MSVGLWFWEETVQLAVESVLSAHPASYPPAWTPIMLDGGLFVSVFDRIFKL
jgi:hypothetical protein